MKFEQLAEIHKIADANKIKRNKEIELEWQIITDDQQQKIQPITESDNTQTSNPDFDIFIDKIHNSVITVEEISEFSKKINEIKEIITSKHYIKNNFKNINSLKKFRVYNSEDLDIVRGKCKIQYDLFFTNYTMIARFEFEYQLNYLDKSPSQIEYIIIKSKHKNNQSNSDESMNDELIDISNNVEETVDSKSINANATFDSSNVSSTILLYEIQQDGKNKIVNDIKIFNVSDLKEIYDKIFNEDNINNNDRDYNYLHNAIKKLLIDNMPNTRRFGKNFYINKLKF